MNYFAGLLNLYGGESMKSVMDQQDEMKVIESTLWKRFVDFQYVAYFSFLNLLENFLCAIDLCSSLVSDAPF